MLFCIVKDALLHGKRAPFTLPSITIWKSEYYKTEKDQIPSYS